MTPRVRSVRLGDGAVRALLGAPSPRALLFAPVSPAAFQDSDDASVWWFPDVPRSWRAFRDTAVACAQMRRKFREGDIVFVQECFSRVVADGQSTVRYRATWQGRTSPAWRSATQMRREDARREYLIRDGGVRVMRLHDITMADAEAAGVPAWWDALSYGESVTAGNLWTNFAIDRGWEKTAPDWRGCFAALWAQTHGAASWNANAWVYRLELALASA